MGGDRDWALCHRSNRDPAAKSLTGGRGGESRVKASYKGRMRWVKGLATMAPARVEAKWEERMMWVMGLAMKTPARMRVS